MKKKSKKSSSIKEYSNFITPPDIVTDSFATVTVVDASPDDLELLVNFCRCNNKSYNIYLYRSEMNEPKWIDTVINLSEAVIVNADISENYCKNVNTFYYGSKTFLSPAIKINSILDYFLNQEN